MVNLKKVALITGGSSGIGNAVTKIFIKQNFIVVNLDLKNSKIKKVKNFFTDLSNINSIKKSFNEIQKNYKRMDVLVNNAALSISNHSSDYSIEDWNRTLAVNLTAPFILTQLFANVAIKNKYSASVVNVSSIGGKLSFPKNPAYQASKAALVHLSKAMAYDFAKHNIRINNVIPGYIKTPMNKKSWEDKSERLLRAKRNLLNRWGTVDEVAETIFFLSSEKSSFINGADIPVDGGWLIKGI